ncbi:AP-1-like transcription factor Yap3p [Monosporozyma unispora]
MQANMDLNIDNSILDDILDIYRGNPEDCNDPLIPSPCSIEVSPANNVISSSNDSSTMASPPTEDNKEWKKKLQNRKAQKAFRLRKEAKLQDLETKLQEAEQLQNELYKEVDTLRRDNIEMNKINRHLSKQQQQYHPHSEQGHFDVAFPSKDEFYDILIAMDSKHRAGNKPVSSLQYNDDSGNILLTVPATWQYLLQIYQDMDDNEMNVDAIMNSLRGHEMCHGHGAAYPKALVDQLVSLNRCG